MYELNLQGAIMGGVLGGVLFCIIMVVLMSVFSSNEKCSCKKVVKHYCPKCGKETEQKGK